MSLAKAASPFRDSWSSRTIATAKEDSGPLDTRMRQMKENLKDGKSHEPERRPKGQLANWVKLTPNNFIVTGKIMEENISKRKQLEPFTLVTGFTTNCQHTILPPHVALTDEAAVLAIQTYGKPDLRARYPSDFTGNGALNIIGVQTGPTLVANAHGLPLSCSPRKYPRVLSCFDDSITDYDFILTILKDKDPCEANSVRSCR